MQTYKYKHRLQINVTADLNDFNSNSVL